MGVIGQTVGHYHILEEIGRGAMGVVFKAEDTQLQCFRALKFLTAEGLEDQSARERFVAEARTLAAVQHPNICPVHEIGEHEGQVFIVMSLLEGRTLEDLLGEGPLPEKQILGIARDVARGLQKAHKSGIVHRDIKPSNIMITDDGHAVIMDFGVAKQKTSLLKTRTGTLMGTLAYLAPEMLQGEPVGPGTDLWALGVVLYEMLSGKRPFSGDYEAAVMFAVTNGQYEPLDSSVKPGWGVIVDRLLEKSPADRYPDAGSLLEALEQFERGEIAEAPARRKTSGARLSRWLTLGLPAVALVVVVTVVVLRLLHSGVGTFPLTSIAVLPLEEIQAEEGHAFFAQGITDELSKILGRIDELTVVSRRSAVKAAELYDDSLLEMGDHLRVGAILEGTVQKSGNRVRVFAQLVQTADGKVIWTDSFDGEIRDILTLQSAMARAIVDAVVVNLSVKAQNVLASSHQVDPVAYELVLEGRYLKEKYGGTLWQALEVFKKATLQDRDYAEAFAEVAGVYQVLGQGQAGPYPGGARAAHQMATAYLDTAFMLDSENAFAHTYRAFGAMYFDWDFEVAEREYLRSIELNPGISQTWDELGFMYAAQSRFEEAIAASRRAVQLDPMIPMRVADLGIALSRSGRVDEGIAQIKAALDLDPDFVPAKMVLGQEYMVAGRCHEAEAIYEELTQPWFQAAALVCQGKNEQAESLLQQPGPDDFPYGKITALAHLGRLDEAFEIVENLIRARDPWVPIAISHRLYQPLYSDPRMTEICQRIGIPVPPWAQ